MVASGGLNRLYYERSESYGAIDQQRSHLGLASTDSDAVARPALRGLEFLDWPGLPSMMAVGWVGLRFSSCEFEIPQRS